MLSLSLLMSPVIAPWLLFMHPYLPFTIFLDLFSVPTSGCIPYFLPSSCVFFATLFNVPWLSKWWNKHLFPEGQLKPVSHFTHAYSQKHPPNILPSHCGFWLYLILRRRRTAVENAWNSISPTQYPLVILGCKCQDFFLTKMHYSYIKPLVLLKSCVFA